MRVQMADLPSRVNWFLLERMAFALEKQPGLGYRRMATVLRGSGIKVSTNKVRLHLRGMMK